jgi:hypothetical protein
VKYISSIMLSFALFITFIANYQFEQDTSGQLFTRIVSVFMRMFSKPPEGPSMMATPFYQDNQFATFVIIFISTAFVLFICIKELQTIWRSGKNKKSAYLLTLSAAILFFNARLAIWNT